MLGIPFWGKETFEDVRGIGELPSEVMTIDKMEELLKSKGMKYQSRKVNDVYSLFLSLAELNYLYVFEEEETFVSWCRDICFNYRDRKIVIPYYRYKTLVIEGKAHIKNPFIDSIDEELFYLRFSYHLGYKLVNDRKDNFFTKDLILYDHIEKKKYLLTFEGLPFFSEKSFSLANLCDRYIDSSFILYEGVVEETWKDYLNFKNRKLASRETKARREIGIPLVKHGDKRNIKLEKYIDVRKYKYEDIYGDKFTDKEVEPFWLRKLLFEGYLYCIMAQGDVLPIEKEYISDFKSLGETKSYFKYKDGLKPLILKGYYTDKEMVTRRKRKTYERWK